ncbi:MAG: hypothetical protein ACREO0_05155 [Pseudoxanthomonas sp.]
MSSTDFLFCLHKLLAWLFAFLSALLPQHLMAQLSAADITPAAYAAPSRLCVRTVTPPHNLGRAVLPQSGADKANATASTSTPGNSGTAASRVTDQTAVRVSQ